MKSKKGLSRAISTLLAALSVIGGASAGKKNVGKRPNSAGVIVNKGSNKLKKQALRRTRAKSAPPLLRNPKTYCFGVPGLFGTAGIGYGVYRLLSKGEKKEEEKKEESAEELLGDVYKMGSYGKTEILRKWGLYGKDFVHFCVCSHNYIVLEKNGFGRLLSVRESMRCSKTFGFRVYIKIEDEKDIIRNLCDAVSFASGMIRCLDKIFDSKDDAFGFMSDRCSGDKYEFKGKLTFTNIVGGEKLLSPDEYLKYLCDKFDNNEVKKNIEKIFKDEYDFYFDKFDKFRKALAENEKEIYINEKDGGVYLRNIKKKQ